MKQELANLTQLAAFDEVIDTRSPAEFGEDHIPDAVNCPALNDAERARIGTLYKQDSPFAARRTGAALVARNIASCLEQRYGDRGREWRPLIYCWRGGKRSGAFATVFRQIGWDARQLEGGYKAYRRLVVAELERLPARLRFRIVSGATGSGKSRLLQALAGRGAQVLDLEALAVHKGSVLGECPGEPQPSQKMFESRLLRALSALDPAQEVFAEAESRKIGTLQVPTALLTAMRTSPCLRIEATIAARVRFLLTDYEYLLTNPERLRYKLVHLRGYQSNDILACWEQLIERGAWPELVAGLLERHYDPLYARSQGSNYAHFPAAPRFHTDDLSPAGLARLAGAIVGA